MKIISWNVNGIRAAAKKGLPELIWRESPEIICLQETKAHRDQVEPSLRNFSCPAGDYSDFWSSAAKKGYSGVATYILNSAAALKPSQVLTNFGHDRYESEGRTVITDHSRFLLYNIYFPNGGSGQERHDFKQEFLNHLYDHLKAQLALGKNIIVVGDYNIAHKEVDIYDPVKLAAESGFLPEERAWFDRFLQLGFVDTFRHLYPDIKDKYTWWSYYERGKIGNRGWRIDYICVSQGLAPYISNVRILDHIEASDHCPVILEMKDL